VLTYIAVSRLAISDAEVALLVIFAVTFVLSSVELARSRPWQNAVNPSQKPLLERFSTTWIGSMTGFYLMAAVWFVLPEYARAYYRPIVDLALFIGIVFPLLSAVVLLVTERWSTAPGSAYHIGKMILALPNMARTGDVHTSGVDWQLVRKGFLSWMVRGFFLPINYCELVYAVRELRFHEFSFMTAPYPQAISLILACSYALIIAAVTPGYLFSSRTIGTETRTVDHTWFAWTVTLVCYPPFTSGVFWRYFNYRASTPSPDWMQPWTTVGDLFPGTVVALGVAIVLSELVHLWAEAQFGIRSSNLSNRGIITTGPLRFTKHPVYLSKCVGWFLIWLPFAAGTSAVHSLQLTILFACVCGIYYLRSHTEEKLLSQDPAYVQYALWMDEHGMLSWLGKRFAPLSFAWKLEHWRRQGTVQ
jgi:protein-S-isoprenylcysteine O-methyltransferase Ste14